MRGCIFFATAVVGPKSYLFRHCFKNSITVLLRYAILAQSTPILLHTKSNGCIFFLACCKPWRTSLGDLMLGNFNLMGSPSLDGILSPFVAGDLGDKTIEAVALDHD